jgi:trans-aconitate 3-methyltransferase
MSTAQPADPTFINYTTAQAQAYAAGRAPYPPALIDTILSLYDDTADRPSSTTLVDVGCGPGTATRQLAPHFSRVIGLDPSAAMIGTARALGGRTRTGAAIEYSVCGAEEIDAELCALGVGLGSVDLVVAATAAHWFDLSRFYGAAARVLRPGGGVVMFCCAGSFVDVAKTDGGVEVQGVLERFERVRMLEWQLKGNDVCGGLYVDLPLPEVDGEGCSPWDVVGIQRRVWDEGTDGLVGGRPSSLERVYTLQQLREAIGTASMVSRWRKEHREALEAGVVVDCVDELMGEVEEVLRRHGCEATPSDLVFCRLKAGLVSIRKLKIH